MRSPLLSHQMRISFSYIHFSFFHLILTYFWVVCGSNLYPLNYAFCSFAIVKLFHFLCFHLTLRTHYKLSHFPSNSEGFDEWGLFHLVYYTPDMYASSVVSLINSFLRLCIQWRMCIRKDEFWMPGTMCIGSYLKN